MCAQDQGTENAIIATKSAGATGWAYEVFNNTAANTVWWKIRWDDGIVGWSAEGVRGAGVYLSLAGQPRPKATLYLQTLGRIKRGKCKVSPTDLNTGATTIALPATLVYLAGNRVSLTAPEVAPNGARFTRWIVNGESHPRRTLTLYAAQVSRITLVYSPNAPQTEEQFLRSLVAPWRQGQVWLPSTYDTHAGNNPEYAVDFNRLSSRAGDLPLLQRLPAGLQRADAGVARRARLHPRAERLHGLWQLRRRGQHRASHRRGAATPTWRPYTRT
jgi:hypothetical protein